MTLTKTEALGLWLLLLLLLVRSLAVDRGDVSFLTAVVAASTTTQPAAHHGSEDDLNAVQVGGKVGPWKTHTDLVEKEQQQR